MGRPTRVQVIWVGPEGPPSILRASLGCWRKALAFDVIHVLAEPVPEDGPYYAPETLLEAAEAHVSKGARCAIICTPCEVDLYGANNEQQILDKRVLLMSSFDWETSHSRAFSIRWALSVIGLAVAEVFGTACARACLLDQGTILEGIHNVTPTICSTCAKRISTRSPHALAELREVCDWAWRTSSPERQVPPPADLPLTADLAVTLGQDHALPLAGYKYLMVLHLLPDLVPFLSAMERLGLAPERTSLVAKPYPYSGKMDTAIELMQAGYDVHFASEHLAGDSDHSVPDDLVRRLLDSRASSETIVVEDGGYFARVAIETGTELRGVVEQTTHGARVSLAAQHEGTLEFPVVSVAGCKFKEDYESPLVGRVVAENIRRLLPDAHLDERIALVLGYGPIGRAVQEMLTRYLRMKTMVVDLDESRVEAARRDGAHEAGTGILRLVGTADLVVGTAGHTTLGADIFEHLKDGAVLVSASSNRSEIAVSRLEGMAGAQGTEVLEHGVVRFSLPNSPGKQVTVLADGYPINFFAAGSVPNHSIDPIMALLLLGAVDVATSELPVGVHDDRPDLLADQTHLLERFRLIQGLPPGLGPDSLRDHAAEGS